MKRKIVLLLMVSMLLGVFAGCKSSAPTNALQSPNAPKVEATQPRGTVPADGNADDVTCKGSYTADVNSDTVVAKAGDRALTNGLLQAFYWAEVGAWRQGSHGENPDFDLPLDRQACPVDESVASWQQYFLKRALNAWHSAAALVLRSEKETLVTEEAYQPNLQTHADNVVGKPATKFLYGYQKTYVPNTMHQAYLDGIPEMLEELAQEKGYASAADMAGAAFGTQAETLKAYAELYNRAYMYLTFLGYDLVPETAEEQSASSDGTYVDIRHILVDSQEEAEDVLDLFEKDLKSNEATFAELAVRYSLDAGTALDGGAYRQLQKGQLPEAMETWCFDPARQPGDMTTITDADGVHLLYFSGSKGIGAAKAEAEQAAQMETALMADAKKQYPMTVQYDAIQLGTADGMVGGSDVLYPDIAHERFPEAPLYLQQDYPHTNYGGFPIRTHGCGITTFSMLSTYMTDTLLTPPTMCARYGTYCHANGTDGMIFIKEPREMGYYFRERTFEPPAALEALKAGYPVVCIQHKGYWTGSGHYMLLEELTEDGLVRVRDSNIANYGKLEGHKVDKHDWKHIPPACGGFWIFEKKITSIPACTRCGDPNAENRLVEDYICHKCAKAQLRRETFLEASGA